MGLSKCVLLLFLASLALPVNEIVGSNGEKPSCHMVVHNCLTFPSRPCSSPFTARPRHNRKVEGKAKSNPPIVGPVGEAGEAGKVKFHPTKGRIGESEQGSRFVIGPGNRLALEFGAGSLMGLFG